MPNGNYTPSVLVDTSNLTRDEWLDRRRKGIGGSDAAAVIGVSPYSTARDLYYEKLNIVTAGDNEDNWVQKKIGHLLEDLVAEIFSKKTGFPVYQVKLYLKLKPPITTQRITGGLTERKACR